MAPFVYSENAPELWQRALDAGAEVVVVNTFRVELDGGGGDLHMTMPYSMVEPIRDLLDAGVQSDRSDRDERWTRAIREEMKQAQVAMQSTLVEASITLRELNQLKANHIALGAEASEQRKRFPGCQPAR